MLCAYLVPSQTLWTTHVNGRCFDELRRVCPEFWSFAIVVNCKYVSRAFVGKELQWRERFTLVQIGAGRNSSNHSMKKVNPYTGALGLRYPRSQAETVAQGEIDQLKPRVVNMMGDSGLIKDLKDLKRWLTGISCRNPGLSTGLGPSGTSPHDTACRAC